MSDVVPLRYGTAFKKAFSDPEVLSGFVRDVIGVDLHFTKVEQEKAFSPPVGKIDVRFDLYAEDTEHRAIVELQHVRAADAFPRFHYYHLIAQIEQVTSSRNYAIGKTVYTIVVLTRLPDEENLRFDMASQSSDLITHDGRPLGLFKHRIVFVNPRALSPSTPAPLRRWLELFEDSLDDRIDESVYPEPLFQKVIAAIETNLLSPYEMYWYKEEAEWEDTKALSFREGETKGKAEGKAEGEAKGLRQAVIDLCDVLGIELDDRRKARLETLGVGGLDALRQQLKQEKRWPD